MDDKLKIAANTYRLGCTCSQAVFSAYAKELGIDEKIACRIMEGFGGGLGETQEICGAMVAACAVISYYFSDGSYNLQKRQENYNKVRQALEMFKKEYGGVTCKEILHADAPTAFQCGMKVKDTVLIIEQIISKERLKQKNNTKGYL